jgi:hypothetical protein
MMPLARAASSTSAFSNPVQNLDTLHKLMK